DYFWRCLAIACVKVWSLESLGACVSEGKRRVPFPAIRLRSRPKPTCASGKNFAQFALANSAASASRPKATRLVYQTYAANCALILMASMVSPFHLGQENLCPPLSCWQQNTCRTGANRRPSPRRSRRRVDLDFEVVLPRFRPQK